MSRRQSLPHTGSGPGNRSGSANDLNASASSSSSFGGHTSSNAVPSGSGLSNDEAIGLLLRSTLGGGGQLSGGSLGRHFSGKRPIALNGIGATVDNKVVDFLCPICFELIVEAHITRCGHTFCYCCILKSIEMFKRCPKCSSSIASSDQVFPNYLLDELITKHKIKTQINDKFLGSHGRNIDVFAQSNSGGSDRKGGSSGTAAGSVNAGGSSSSDGDGNVCDSATSSNPNSDNDGLKQFLTSESQKLTLLDVKIILGILTQRKQMLEVESCAAQNRLLYDFLKQLLLQKEKKRAQIEKEITLVQNDIKEVETLLKDEPANRTLSEKNAVPSDEDVTMAADILNNLREDGAAANVTHSDSNLTADDGFNTLRSESTAISSTSSQTYISRKRRMYAHFDDFVTSYFSIRSRDLLFGGGENADGPKDQPNNTTESMSVPIGTESSQTVPNIQNSTTKRPRNTLDIFRENLVGFSKYNTLRPLATMHYSSDLHNNSTIVSTIVFDKDNEFFAIGGVTRRIKVFDYLAVVRDTVDIHYPNVEMVSSSKISCIAWNSYHKNIMASSDYEGAVNLWDVQTGLRTKCFHEHEKRCWSVDFNDVDSRLIASGSDDSRVKLWTLNDEHSVATLEVKANVCCVKFNPQSSCHLAFGSADHDVHYYDLRNMNKPLCIFKGHKKAVSYVKFLNANEIISASTDSQLKLWNVNEPPFCLRSYVGHVNEKNFVGLATDGDYVACGSEDNAVYVYFKGLSKPLFNYKIDGSSNGSNGSGLRGSTNGSTSLRNSLGGLSNYDVDRSNDINEFVSAVCWRKQCNVVLAANSRGIIKVLELV